MSGLEESVPIRNYLLSPAQRGLVKEGEGVAASGSAQPKELKKLGDHLGAAGGAKPPLRPRRATKRSGDAPEAKEGIAASQRQRLKTAHTNPELAAQAEVERLATTVMAVDKSDKSIADGIGMFLKLTPEERQDRIDSSQIEGPNPVLMRIVRELSKHPAGAGMAACASARLSQSLNDLLGRCFIGAIASGTPSSQTISPVSGMSASPEARDACVFGEDFLKAASSVAAPTGSVDLADFMLDGKALSRPASPDVLDVVVVVDGADGDSAALLADLKASSGLSFSAP